MTAVRLCFSTLHIVGSETSKLPSTIYGSLHSLGGQLRSLPIRFHLKLHSLALSLQDLVVVGSEVLNLGVELRLHPWIWEVRHTVQHVNLMGSSSDYQGGALFVP